MNVRRRLWFRTCVPDSHLWAAQDRFLSYFAQRPRGATKVGNLQRQGPMKIMWYDSFVTLTDSQLEVILLKYESPFRGGGGGGGGAESEPPVLDDWYLGKNLGLKRPSAGSLFAPSSSSASASVSAPAPRQLAFLGGGVVKYPLHGCEVVELSSLESAESQSESADSSSTSKIYQFALRTGKSWGETHFPSASASVSAPAADEPDSICRYTSQESHRLLCVFNAYSLRDYHEWIHALRNQIALVNLHFWPFLGSPPILDKVLTEGSLWLRGQQRLLLSPQWKHRKFELRQDGVLAYSRDNKVIGKIRLRLCSIEDCETLLVSSSLGCGPFQRQQEEEERQQQEEQHLFQIRNDSEGFEVTLKASTVLDKMRWITALREHSNVDQIIRNDG
jgi:hypothetical protein